MWGRRTFLTDLAGGAPIRPSRLIPMTNLMTGFLPISEYNHSLNPQITRPVTVISTGVDAQAFAPDPAVVRHARRVMYLGRVVEIAARDKLKASGARVLGDGQPKIGAHGKPVLFLHPKDFAGTLVELEEA